jgi:hypothetical protein
MRTFIAAAASLLLLTTALMADPVGKYAVKGKDAKSAAPYAGTVVVERTGDTYRIVWDIEGTTYVGTGIGSKDFIAISYKSKDSSGIALYGADGAGWRGIWAYTGSKDLGTEEWTRQE